ncbi:hypothetical protein KW798_03065, partial [Candidatus Parcubacteria bacterium]|nr:hypothetical protein [Candidatus Parcubacteria bacterium]
NRDFAVKHNRSFENNVWRTFGTIRDVAMENRYTPRVTVLCNRIITAVDDFPKRKDVQIMFAQLT